MRELLHLARDRSRIPRSPPCNAPARQPATGVFDSSMLLHGQREILIRHGDELYRLRHTRNDKLILTK